MVYCDILIDGQTDTTLAMAVKFSNKSLYSIMNGFPVLRVPPDLRDNINKIMQANQPQNLL